MSRLPCQCYKSAKEPNIPCPHPALVGSRFCGLHKTCGKKLIKIISKLPDKPIYFYENAMRMKNFELFKPFVGTEDNEMYDENFTREEHIRSIVDYEIRYTSYVISLSKQQGWLFDPYQPYFTGFGSTSIVYSIVCQGVKSVLKLIWGANSRELYDHVLRGQKLAEEAGIPTVQLFWSNYADHKGLIVQSYGGETLEKLIEQHVLTNIQKNKIIKQLESIDHMLSDNGLIHDDLHSGNVVVDQQTTVRLIDLEELMISKRPPRFPMADLIQML